MHSLPDISQAEWLRSPATQIVFASLENGGYRARAVGGAVRNTLMARAVNDIDIATDARPEDVVRLCLAAGLTVHETGLQHGTVTVISNNVPYEVTTLRTDVQTDGRHATVAFTTDWVADAGRRDFTINALYCDVTGEIYDPLGGYPDVAEQRVRFIGDASARIREDYLRILRFFRFSGIFGDGSLDEEGMAAVTAEQAGLDSISSERIRSELLKTLTSPQTRAVTNAMADAGILDRVLGEHADLDSFTELVAMERGLAPRIEPNALLRLSALVGFAPEPGSRVAHRLRLSNAERRDLSDCATSAALDLGSPVDIRAALYRHGKATTEHAAVLQAVRRQSPDAATAILDIAETWPIPRFPLTGADLLEHGHTAGPKLGQTLRALEAAWVASDFTLSREELLAHNNGAS